MTGIAEIIRQNQRNAEIYEKFINQRNFEDYTTRYKNWSVNEPIRKALGLFPEAEPQPPLIVNAFFDPDAMVLVVTEGPERAEKISPPAPVPVESEPSLPGEPFAGRPDFRKRRAHDLSDAGDPPVEYEGAMWWRVGNPFSGGSWNYWRRQ